MATKEELEKELTVHAVRRGKYAIGIAALCITVSCGMQNIYGAPTRPSQDVKTVMVFSELESKVHEVARDSSRDYLLTTAKPLETELQEKMKNIGAKPGYDAEKKAYEDAEEKRLRMVSYAGFAQILAFVSFFGISFFYRSKREQEISEELQKNK